VIAAEVVADMEAALEQFREIPGEMSEGVIESA
jgi:hypothetical protein